MSVINVSRQLGSHGGRIARGVALKLGWPIADKSTINKVIRQYGLTQLDDLHGDKPPTFWGLFDQNSVWTIEWMNKTIQAIAARGDTVILGRGGFAVLDGFSDVLNVFIKADGEVRSQRISLRDDITQSEAAKKVAADDKARAKFTRLLYSRDWADEHNFDLVIDTSKVTDEMAMDQIIESHRAMMANPSAGPRVSDLDVDPVLAATVGQMAS